MRRIKINKKLVIFDLDGTLVNTDCFKLFLINILIHTPSRWFHIPLLILNVIIFYLNPKYTRDKLKLFFLKIIIKGQSKVYIKKRSKIFANYITKFKLNKNIFKYLQKYKEKKYHLVLATGSLDVYANEIAYLLGFNYVISTELSSSIKTYDGFFINKNCTGITKFEAVEKFIKTNNFQWSETVFFSDHHSDLPIFRKSQENFVIKPSLFLIKELKKYKINYKVIN